MGFSDARFDVNLSILFTELPLLERPAAAAAAGFTAGTQLVGLNFYAGQLPGPDRGALSVPGKESERFRANVEVAADFAQSLGCTAAHRVGATLLIEALNAPESPRYPIVSAPKAIEVVQAVNAATGLDNARFLMDLYHLARNGEDLEAVIDRYTPLTTAP